MIHCEYTVTNEVPCIWLFGRDKNGKRTIKKDTTFRPYFYCLEKEKKKFETNSNVLHIEDSNKTSIEGEKVCKITCKIPKHVAELRKLVSKSFEADILYPTRYTIDTYNEIKGVPLSVLYLDIETYSPDAFPSVQLANDKITSISCFNNVDKKLITFVWRKDLVEGFESCGKKVFATATGEIYEYNDFNMFYKDETSMLNGFIRYVKDTDPDIFTGWNVKDFDMMYIINRMQRIGLNASAMSPMGTAFTDNKGFKKEVIIKGRIIFDMLSAYKKMNYGELESFKLDNVAYKELGEKKLKFSGSIANLWKNDLDTFIEYNKKDTMLVYRIEKKKKIIQSFDEIRRLAKCSFNDVFNNSRVVDCFVLSFCKDKYALPTKQRYKKERYGGGKVLTPKKGMHEWVSVFDFAALYPKIISSLNSSPETIRREEDENTSNLNIPYMDMENFTGKDSEYHKLNSLFDNFFEKGWDLQQQEFVKELPPELKGYVKYKHTHFTQNKKGFLPELLEYLYEERTKIKKERDKYEYGHPEYIRLELKQYSMKVLMNSAYGVIAYKRFRIYKPEIAESITFVARNAILWSKKILEDKGYEIIAGDTDSVFVQSKDKDNYIEEGGKIADLLQKSYDDFAKLFNIKTHHLQIEFEKTFKRIFFGDAKKRYAGQLDYYKGKKADKMSITGFEVVRSDNSNLARSTQKKVFSMLIKDNAKKKEVIDYLKKVGKDIRADKYDCETIGIPTPLKKPLSEYKSNLPTVRAVVYSNRYLKLDIRPGEKFFLLYVNDVKGKPRTDVIAVRENADVPDIELDYEKHVKETTIAKMKAIFDGLGWRISEISGQKSVLDF